MAASDKDKVEKGRLGRPPGPPIQGIPDSFENVVKALVRPVQKKPPKPKEG